MTMLTTILVHDIATLNPGTADVTYLIAPYDAIKSRVLWMTRP